MEKEKTIGYIHVIHLVFTDCRSLTLKAIDFSYLYYILFIFPHISVRIFLFFPVFWNYCVNRWVWIFLNGTHTHTLPTKVSVEQTILSRLSSRLGLGRDRLLFAFVIPFLFFENKDNMCVCIPIEREKERAHNWKRGLYLSLCAIPRKCYISWEFFRSCLLHHFC